MYLKKVITTYKGKTCEYAQIVKSVRRKDGKPSMKVVKSLGRMRTEKDWERARKIKNVTITRLKDVTILCIIIIGEWKKILGSTRMVTSDNGTPLTPCILSGIFLVYLLLKQKNRFCQDFNW